MCPIKYHCILRRTHVDSVVRLHFKVRVGRNVCIDVHRLFTLQILLLFIITWQWRRKKMQQYHHVTDYCIPITSTCQNYQQKLKTTSQTSMRLNSCLSCQWRYFKYYYDNMSSIQLFQNDNCQTCIPIIA